MRDARARGADASDLQPPVSAHSLAPRPIIVLSCSHASDLQPPQPKERPRSDEELHDPSEWRMETAPLIYKFISCNPNFRWI